MAYVIKIKYENSLRRLTLQKNELGEGDLSFAKFEGRIRDLFQLAPTANLGLTYTDTENDVVTMATDQDVQDALVHQSLNPLRVFVTLVDRKSDPDSGSPKVEKSVVNETEILVKKLLRNLSTNTDFVKKAVQSYEPLIEGVSSSPSGQASALVEKLVSTISAQVAAAVKHGADAAALAKPFGFGQALPWQSSGKASSPPETSSRSSDAFNAAAAAAAAAEAVKDGASLFSDVFNAADGAARKAEATKEGTDPENVVHHAVGCDVCGVNPIVGVRWKSNKKYDYDLCSRCFKEHGKESEFTKIEQSMFRARHLHNPHCHQRMPMGPPFHPMGPSHYHGGRPFGMRGGPFGGRFQCGPMMGAGGGKLDARFVCDVTMFDGTEVVPGTRFTKIWRLRNSGSVPWPQRTNLVHVGGDELGQVPTVPLEISAEGLAPEAEMEAAVDLVAPVKPGRYVSHWRLASPAGPKFGHRIWVVIQVVSHESTDRAVEQEPVKEDTSVQTPESGIHVQDDIAHPEVVATPSDSPQVAVAESANSSSSGENKAGQVAMVRLQPTMSFVKVEVPIPDAEGEVEAVPLPTDTKLAENGVEVGDSAVERDLGEAFSAVERDLGEAFSMVDVTFGSITPDDFVFTSKNESVNGSSGGSGEADNKVEEKVELSVGLSAAEKVDEEPITYPVLDVTRDQGPITYPVMTATLPENVEPAVAENPRNGMSASEVDLSTPSALLGKLDAMGFTDSKLNLELLEKNNLDLRKTLDDLCAVEEWDPILEELEEMGFYDADMNRRLMFKNNGSVKRVVKELVQMYRDLQGKGKSVE